MRLWPGWVLLAAVLAFGDVAFAQEAPAPPATPGQAAPAEDNKPLPPVGDLLQAVEKHEDRDDTLLAQYTYHAHSTESDFDGKDQVKKTAVTDSESIPINGVRVRKVVARNGQPLSPEEARKEDERFNKEVEQARKRKDKYEAKKAEAEQQGKSNNGFLPASRILQLGTFSNERRISLNGRPTIVLDYAGNRDVKTANPLERVVVDLVGTVWIDEQDKVLAHVEGHFLNDFKVAGGLLADIHKGLTFNMEQQKINGEVWLPKHFGGQGKASFGLFLARVHGSSEVDMSDYRKYHTSATIVGSHGAIDDNGKPVEPADPSPPTASPAPASPKQ